MSTIATPAAAGDPGGVARGEGEAVEHQQGVVPRGPVATDQLLEPPGEQPDRRHHADGPERRTAVLLGGQRDRDHRGRNGHRDRRGRDGEHLPEQEEVVVLLRERLRPRAQVLVELAAAAPTRSRPGSRAPRTARNTGHSNPGGWGAARLQSHPCPVRVRRPPRSSVPGKYAVAGPSRFALVPTAATPARRGQFRACARAGVGSFRLADLAMVPIQDHGLSSRGTP